MTASLIHIHELKKKIVHFSLLRKKGKEETILEVLIHSKLMQFFPVGSN